MQLRTARPGAPSTAFFQYDAKERLQASYDDFSGASLANPLMSYAYQDPTNTSDTKYDATGRPIQIAQTSATDALDLSFDYDGRFNDATAAGQLGRLTRTRGDGWERSALFDPLGRPYEQHTALTGWRDPRRLCLLSIFACHAKPIACWPRRIGRNDRRDLYVGRSTAGDRQRRCRQQSQGGRGFQGPGLQYQD